MFSHDESEMLVFPFNSTTHKGRKRKISNHSTINQYIEEWT